MILARKIIENETLKRSEANQSLVLGKLKELIEKFPEEVHEVLHKTGVYSSRVKPNLVTQSLIIKHVGSNAKLREAISKMILTLDDYSSANGQVTGIIGGALMAVGSVLNGISNSRNFRTEPNQELLRQMERERLEAERERQRRSRNNAILIGLLILGLIIAVVIFKSKKSKGETGGSKTGATPDPALV